MAEEITTTTETALESADSALDQSTSTETGEQTETGTQTEQTGESGEFAVDPKEEARQQYALRQLEKMEKEEAEIAEEVSKSLETTREEEPAARTYEQDGVKNPQYGNWYEHPGVKDLDVVQNGLVDYLGTAVTPQYAAKMWELEQQLKDVGGKAGQLEEFKKQQEAERVAKAEEARQAKRVEYYDSLIISSMNAIKANIEKNLPNIPAEKMPKVIKFASREFEELLHADAEAGNKTTYESIKRLSKEAYESTREAFNWGAVAQIASNEKHAKDYPLQPGGGTAAKQAPRKATTPTERDALARETAAKLMEQAS